ncbi:PilT-like protein [Candidatus Vecturithrix granuli]|uniref:PilT-like protein n=1 Tax=Vecturithrix granuli TaxID=1499967 RepID=A0A081C8Q2_VECG1|nr:PilT-like protein [Candidatus Vecturithrix granuli]
MKALYVVDSHALIWHLQNARALSSKVRQIFLQVDHGQATAVIPTIVLVEMTYLAEKKRIAETLVQTVFTLLGTGSENYQLAPLDLEIVTNLTNIPRVVVPDMPDRLIAATALTLNLPLISRDMKIMNLTEIEVIW